ncbi:MAG: Helicase IV [candidate division WS6 bacterium GW2011_GWF2_39_15]|uniref:DNA 3'-5' helicase n=1 Tax=candidate division WS6 bacterium GW2011_GWF2_39_15 TaxID=1619100 RepID=A0A0G0MSB7_9BACT|nr:MAG: Helicase IV [candidate division WS6 bacterium GW2011_GWF2_39_15]
MLTFKKYLSPLIDKLDELKDFKDVDITSDVLKQEYPYLQNVTSIVSKRAASLFSRLKELENELEKQVLIIENETGDDKKEAVKIYNQLMKMINEHVKRINRELQILDIPYFGKVVFNRVRSEKFPKGSITSYIGKFAYFDRETNSSLITDWRAPIANLYYTNSGPTEGVEFTSPLGQQMGSIEQKRMFEISKARIKSIYDAKTGNTAADEFLLSQLNQKIGQKLTDIVSTIQNEQNRIIRDKIDKLSVLQGVAGSGKTTIVLHRLAYLFFTYNKQIKAEKTLIIAPNKLFLDYISDVLPSLGIDGVETNTYLFWAKKVLNWSNKHILANIKPDPESQMIKGSKEFLIQLVEGFTEYIDELLEGLPFSNSEKIYRNYYEIRAKSADITPVEALKLSVQKEKNQLMYKGSTTASFLRRNELYGDVITEKIEDYLKQGLDIMMIYKKIVSKMSIPSAVKQRTDKIVRKLRSYYTYEADDLPALLILHLLLNGSADVLRDYIIADEAQDLSYSQIYSMYLTTKKSNLMLAGDLAQAIREPNCIDDWIELIETTKKLNHGELSYEYHQLNKCYRTTIEIINYVTTRIDRVFPKSYLRPEAVLRHGEPVDVLQSDSPLVEGKSGDIKRLAEKIKEELDKSRNTIAVITKDAVSAQSLYEHLEKEGGLSQYLIPIGVENYSAGVIITPVLNAKGLEFDSVFLIDVNSDNYPSTFESARKFYVAGTRALHHLTICFTKNHPSDILQV